MTDQALVLGVEDGLRQFPLNSIVNVTTVQINGESVSDNTAEKLHALLTYGVTSQDLDKNASVSTAMPDQYQALTSSDRASDYFNQSLVECY